MVATPARTGHTGPPSEIGTDTTFPTDSSTTVPPSSDEEDEVEPSFRLPSPTAPSSDPVEGTPSAPSTPSPSSPSSESGASTPGELEGQPASLQGSLSPPLSDAAAMSPSPAPSSRLSWATSFGAISDRSLPAPATTTAAASSPSKVQPQHTDHIYPRWMFLPSSGLDTPLPAPVAADGASLVVGWRHAESCDGRCERRDGVPSCRPLAWLVHLGPKRTFDADPEEESGAGDLPTQASLADQTSASSATRATSPSLPSGSGPILPLYHRPPRKVTQPSSTTISPATSALPASPPRRAVQPRFTMPRPRSMTYPATEMESVAAQRTDTNNEESDPNTQGSEDSDSSWLPSSRSPSPSPPARQLSQAEQSPGSSRPQETSRRVAERSQSTPSSPKEEEDASVEPPFIIEVEEVSETESTTSDSDEGESSTESDSDQGESSSARVCDEAQSSMESNSDASESSDNSESIESDDGSNHSSTGDSGGSCASCVSNDSSNSDSTSSSSSDSNSSSGHSTSSSDDSDGSRAPTPKAVSAAPMPRAKNVVPPRKATSSSSTTDLKPGKGTPPKPAMEFSAPMRVVPNRATPGLSSPSLRAPIFSRPFRLSTHAVPFVPVETSGFASQGKGKDKATAVSDGRGSDTQEAYPPKALSAPVTARTVSIKARYGETQVSPKSNFRAVAERFAIKVTEATNPKPTPDETTPTVSRDLPVTVQTEKTTPMSTAAANAQTAVRNVLAAVEILRMNSTGRAVKSHPRLGDAPKPVMSETSPVNALLQTPQTSTEASQASAGEAKSAVASSHNAPHARSSIGNGAPPKPAKRRVSYGISPICEEADDTSIAAAEVTSIAANPESSMSTVIADPEFASGAQRPTTATDEGSSDDSAAMSGILARLSTLEFKLETLTADNAALKADNATLKATLSRLEGEAKAKNLSAIEARLETISAESTKLVAATSRIEEEDAARDADLEALWAENTFMKTSVSRLQAENAAARARDENHLREMTGEQWIPVIAPHAPIPDKLASNPLTSMEVLLSLPHETLEAWVSYYLNSSIESERHTLVYTLCRCLGVPVPNEMRAKLHGPASTPPAAVLAVPQFVLSIAPWSAGHITIPFPQA